MTAKLEEFDLDNIWIGKKSHENILIYDLFYKTLIGPKPLLIRFDKIDGFIKIYDETKYLIFLALKNMTIFMTALDILRLISHITYLFSHYFAKVDSGDCLPTEKKLTLHNDLIQIKSVLNKDKNHYYCMIFLEKYSYQSTKK